MKIVTYSKVGYNAPGGANWAYGIFKIDLIDTDNLYCMSYTVKENFGGDSRLRDIIKTDCNYQMIETKGIYTGTGTQKITGLNKVLDMESVEVINIIKEFLNTK